MTFIERLANILGHPATAALIGIAIGVCAFRFLSIYGKREKENKRVARIERKYQRRIAELTVELDAARKENTIIGAERFEVYMENKILRTQLENERFKNKQLLKGVGNDGDNGDGKTADDAASC